MELKTLTLLLRENKPTAQKVMDMCPRDSASPEHQLALVKALRVSQHILYLKKLQNISFHVFNNSGGLIPVA